MSIIYYLNAPSGAGKTHNLRNHAAELYKQSRRVLFFQPTKQLITKTIEDGLPKYGEIPAYRVFNGDTVHGAVGRDLVEFITKGDYGNEIIFCCTQTLPHIPYLLNKHDFDVIIDEEIQVARQASFDLPHTHHLITDLIGLETYNSIFSRVVVTNTNALERIARNQDGDDIHETFRELAQTLLNKNWDSYVNTEQYQKLLDGKQKTLSVHSVLNPKVLTGFRSILIAAANFTDSLVYQLWSTMGIEFREDTALADQLRFHQHKNGHLITIKYAISKAWSKKLRQSKLDPTAHESPDCQSAIIQAAKHEFGEAEFLWQANKEFTGNPFGSNGQRVPNMPHGLNDYSGIDNIVFLSSLNPKSDHFQFLKSFGLSGDQVRTAIYYSALYQSCLRTSIRDPNNTSPKTISVPDLGAAEYLHALFPGSKMEKLDTGILDLPPAKPGRRRKHPTDNDRKRDFRHRQRRTRLLDGLFHLSGSLSIVGGQLDDQNMQGFGDEMGIDSNTDIVAFPPIFYEQNPESYYSFFQHQPLFATIYRETSSSYPEGYLRCADIETFVEALRIYHNRQVRKKKHSGMLSPAIFDPHLDGTGTKTRHHIRYLQHIWLDFENGVLKPETLVELFPNLKIVIFNTFNHELGKPRFRAIFLCSRPLTPDVYEALWDEIAAKLEEAGYAVERKRKRKTGNRKPSGLDASKRPPTSLFYAPSQAKQKDDSFFTYYEGDDRQWLDPIPWINNAIVPLQPYYIGETGNQPIPTTIDPAKIEQATAIWRTSPQFPAEGNDRFYRYARSLRNAGMDLAAIKHKLEEEAVYGRHPDERRQQIPSILVSLRKRREFGKDDTPILVNPDVSSDSDELLASPVSAQ